MSKILTAAFRLADHLKTVRVEVPELDCTVILRQLTVGQMRELSGMDDFVKQLALMIVDEEGNRVFKTPEELANLSNISSPVATRLHAIALQLNGLSSEAVDEMVKNSQASPNGASASA